MKIVVGLGNFGDKYAYTFHNMGFLAVDCIADRLGIKLKTKECSSLTGVGSYNGEKVVLAKPLTYMNLSGRAVKELMARYKAESEDVTVIFDDIDIPKGTVRVRQSGSGGTHNGMRNVVAECGTENFPRIRIGIGRPPENVPLADYVLGDVPRAERPALCEAIEKACDEWIERL
ncbi:MAG: aminoacyl-tRNA hydrolase [Clostridia bacterium]|jgi:PTH1 family peptidyl-tRNA hydrolase|uniref:aminoacyl-tRNA hydrolase n=1 Tax=Pumilibacter muris TaxID=2941510 RepID=UPI00203B708E|nr:aminoacyl-tRNA hydrolase [Pumilibacter muris]MCI8595252.1 aminoacyl-tRNA hydrolase [Clostridia bacterium]